MGDYRNVITCTKTTPSSALLAERSYGELVKMPGMWESGFTMYRKSIIFQRIVFVAFFT